MVDSTDKDKTQFHTGEFVYVMPDENAIGNQQRDEIKETEQSKNKKKIILHFAMLRPFKITLKYVRRKWLLF